MLTDSRIIKYYGFISRFWTGKRDSAQYNVDQDFAVWHVQGARTLDVIGGMEVSYIASTIVSSDKILKRWKNGGMEVCGGNKT